jgi:K+-transporting ATPase KdpF subunit
MGLGELAANLGLVAFTLVAVGLLVYLAYAMLRPEAF